jgi:NTP pyrophosphatase (non-canonical NTP hydrolase)
MKDKPKMKDLFDRIKIASSNDSAADSQSMMMYIIEEVGEIATCIAVEEGLKDRTLKEPKESECCDVLISVLGLIARNKDWDYDKIIEAMSKKLPKWEKRVNKVQNDKSQKASQE